MCYQFLVFFFFYINNVYNRRTCSIKSGQSGIHYQENTVKNVEVTNKVFSTQKRKFNNGPLKLYAAEIKSIIMHLMKMSTSNLSIVWFDNIDNNIVVCFLELITFRSQC